MGFDYTTRHLTGQQRAIIASKKNKDKNTITETDVTLNNKEEGKEVLMSLNLYHYTSAFEGIVKNRTLRLVQSTQSNDEKDTVHIHDLIEQNKDYFYINEPIKENRVIDFFCLMFLVASKTID